MGSDFLRGDVVYKIKPCTGLRWGYNLQIQVWSDKLHQQKEKKMKRWELISSSLRLLSAVVMPWSNKLTLIWADQLATAEVEVQTLQLPGVNECYYQLEAAGCWESQAWSATEPEGRTVEKKKTKKNNKKKHISIKAVFCPFSYHATAFSSAACFSKRLFKDRFFYLKAFRDGLCIYPENI